MSGQDLACDAGNFTQGAANISSLQTSSQLLPTTLSILGAPSNSTVFLPTDAAWAAFRAANGAAHAHARNCSKSSPTSSHGSHPPHRI